MSWIIKIKNRLKKKRKRISFSGHFQTWLEAQEKSAGYDAIIILERTKAALMKVISGEAAYERDSVTFPEVEHSFPVLAALLRTAVKTSGRLAVLDFGGALGSSYFQCREFLAPIKRLVWTVVEQCAHVECGKLYFQTEQLRFHSTVEESLTEETADILLVSSVIQYVPKPYTLLAELLANKIGHVIIDRTAFLQRDRDRLTIQTVPEAIYDASYPAWFLSETKFKEHISAAGYRIVAEFPAIDKLSPEDEKAYHKGFILELITPPEPVRLS